MTAASPELPADVAVAVVTLGSPARVAILRSLLDAPAQTRGELASELAMTPKNVQFHLGRLAAASVVRADPPAADARSGQRVRYEVVASRLRELQRSLDAYLA